MFSRQRGSVPNWTPRRYPSPSIRDSDAAEPAGCTVTKLRLLLTGGPLEPVPWLAEDLGLGLEVDLSSEGETDPE